MKIGDVYQSNFIRADGEGRIDIEGKPYEMLATIVGVDTAEFKPKKTGDKPDRQITVTFKEIPKMPLGLNITNARAIEGISGSDDTDDWIGTVVELFTVPEDQSKTGHAIRVRKPRTRTPAPAPAAFKPLGNDGANRLSKRLKDENRSEANLRAHLTAKFPQHAVALAGDIPAWPMECGLSIAEWFKKPEEPAFGVAPAGEEDIPF